MYSNAEKDDVGGSMKLIELLPLIENSTVNVYEKRKYGPPRFIVLINPKKNKGCISDDLLDREIYKISAGYNSKFNIYVCNKKDDEELIKKAASIGLIEDVNNDDSNEDVVDDVYGMDWNEEDDRNESSRDKL